MPPRYLPSPQTALNSEIWDLSPELQDLVSSLGATYIAPQSFFCEDGSKDRCMTRLEDSQEGLVVFDDGHLNAAPARYFVSAIAQQVFNDR